MTSTSYTWDTVSNSTGLSGDDVAGSVSIGFNFPFAGSSYSTAYINTNGWVNFTAANNALGNTSLPGSLNGVFLWWDDINSYTAGTLTYGTLGSAPNRRFVLSYNNYSVHGSDGTYRTMQLVLYEDGRIDMRYGSMVSAGSATVGVQVSGTDAVQYSGSPSLTAMSTYSALRFTPSGGGTGLPSYYPSGPQTNVNLSTITSGGWTQCYVATMATSIGVNAENVTNVCNGTYLMMAGRSAGSSTFLSLAAALRSDTLTNTGSTSTTNFFNGSKWWFGPSWSWGFVAAADTVANNSCNTASGTLGMCLHTDANGGYRINNTMSLNGDTSYEKVFFVSNGTSTGLDHLEVTAASSNAVSCAPVSFTIKACANAACSALFTNGVTGTLSFSGSGVVSAPAGGAAFSIASGASSTTVSAQVVTASTATVGLTSLSRTPVNSKPVWCGLGTSASSTASCQLSVANAGFLFDVPNFVASTTQSVSVSAVRSSDNSLVCVPAFFSATKMVNMKCSYSNPATGTLPVLFGGTALNAAADANAACDGTGRTVPLTFNASGIALFTLRYADVGQMSLTTTYTGSGADAGLTLSGSDSFIAAPSSFAFSGITAGNLVAGQAFSATVTARGSGSVTTPNFGRESPPATVTLSHTRAAPTGAGANNGSFSGSLGSFSGGSASANNLAWTEVGRIDLVATLSGGSYLGSGLSASGIGYGVGPFLPASFHLAATPACGSFTYAGQPYTLTITARNAGGATTLNYNGTAATSPIQATAVTLSVANGLAVGSLSGNSVPASAFSAGVATASPTYTFTNKLTAPQSLVLRATDANSTSSAGGTEPTMALRSGRLKLSNAFGKANTALQVPVTAEYWSGASWVVNGADSCTTVPAAAVAISNKRTAMGATSTASTSASAITLSGGQGTLSLAAPTPAGQSLMLDLSLNLGSTSADQSCLSAHPATTGAARAWLRSSFGNCTATHDRDPAGRAAFGIFTPESRKTIHLREMY